MAYAGFVVTYSSYAFFNDSFEIEIFNGTTRASLSYYVK